MVVGQRETEPATMTSRGTNQQRSLAVFLARKSEFDALLADLQQAGADHFSADPDAVLWAQAAWLTDATRRLRDLADQQFRRGDYAA
jgi:hypothetical protein